MNKAEIIQILDCPKLYLIQYYDNLKTKIDIKYETELQSINETQSKEETAKEWTKLIGIVDKCLAKCINNTIPVEVVNRTKDTLDTIESIEDLEQIEHELQSYLFSNDSYFVIFESKKEQIVIIEEKFTQREVA